MDKRYRIVIKKAGDNYSVHSPDVDGCIATGPTPNDAKRNYQEALQFHIEGLIEDGLPVPEPSMESEVVVHLD